MVRLDDALAHLDDTQRMLQAKVDPDALDTLQHVAASIADLRRQGATVRRDIGRTDARLRRPTLTIGAVGRGGQGKSRFLQSLTGLSDKEIPAARGGFMTGAPSLIRPGTGPTTAEVEFHDAASFLADLIAPYYRELGLGPPPSSLAEFERTRPPALPAEASMRASHAYDHLGTYRDNLAAYRNYLVGQHRVQSVPPEEILRFVAQHDGAGRPTHDFRAVRRVRITAQFLHDDLGQLAVIDLPGLGDTNLHDEHVLRQALDGEVDLVLFIRRPDPLREDVHDVDVDLYDVVRTALPELPVEQWSFLVLNRVEGGDGDNTAMIEQYAAAVRRSRIRVTDIAAANCTDPAQVAEVFDTVVEQAVRTLDDLDRSLVDRRELEVATLLADAMVLVGEAQVLARRAVPRSAWFPRFLQLFNDTHGRLSRGLDELVEQLRGSTTEHDDELAAAIKAALHRARANVVVPSSDEIVTRAAKAGAYGTVFNDLTNELRPQISRQFLDLDAALKLRVDAMHRQVAEVLTDAGQLGTLHLGGAHEFLCAFAARLPDDGTTAELRFGFQFLTEFTLNYRGLIQHRVRRVLDKLKPDSMPYDASAGAEGIEYILQELVAETLFEIETELENLIFEPREAVFAVVEEFRDRVLRSQGAVDEWRTVYEALRSDVWAEEFEALAANTELFNQWTRAVEGVATAAGGQLPVLQRAAG